MRFPNYNKEMLKVTRDDARVHHKKICKETIATNKVLEERMTSQDYTMIQEVTEKSRENKFIKERERLKNKFSELCQQNNREKNKQTEDVNTKLRHEVHDMTKDGIENAVKAYLKLGPDFSETPRKMPFEKIIVETEKMCVSQTWVREVES